MIILPSSPGLRLAQQEPLDFGFFQRPATGAAATRIDRPGERIKAGFEYPPMRAETASVFVSRLMEAKSAGIRVPWPLMINQGDPGNPVVVAAGSGGTALNIGSASDGYEIEEGFWLNVVDSEGVHYLHNVRSGGTVSGGSAGLTVWPPLRADLANGQLVVLDTPKLEGFVIEHSPFPRPHNRIVTIGFTVEEAQ